MVKQGKRIPLTLDDIPPEIRKGIFKYCVDWNGEYMVGWHSMPPLLIALRGHCPLSMYLEVLWHLYTQNMFFIQLPPCTAKSSLIGLPGLLSALRALENLQRITLEFHPGDLQNPVADEDLIDGLDVELGATDSPEMVLAREVDEEEGYELFMDTWFWVADEGGWR
jgi:hypothetical protein